MRLHIHTYLIVFHDSSFFVIPLEQMGQIHFPQQKLTNFSILSALIPYYQNQIFHQLQIQQYRILLLDFNQEQFQLNLFLLQLSFLIGLESYFIFVIFLQHAQFNHNLEQICRFLIILTIPQLQFALFFYDHLCLDYSNVYCYPFPNLNQFQIFICLTIYPNTLKSIHFFSSVLITLSFFKHQPCHFIYYITIIYMIAFLLIFDLNYKFMGVSCLSTSKKPILNPPVKIVSSNMTLKNTMQSSIKKQVKQNKLLLSLLVDDIVSQQVQLPYVEISELNGLQYPKLLQILCNKKYNCFSQRHTDKSVRKIAELSINYSYKYSQLIQYEQIRIHNNLYRIRGAQFIQSDVQLSNKQQILVFHNLGCFIVSPINSNNIIKTNLISNIEVEQKVLTVLIYQDQKQPIRYKKVTISSLKQNYQHQMHTIFEQYKIQFDTAELINKNISKISLKRQNQKVNCLSLNSKICKTNNIKASELLFLWNCSSNSSLHGNTLLIIKEVINSTQIQLPRQFDHLSYAQFKGFIKYNKINIFEKILIQKLKGTPLTNVRIGIIIYFLKWISNSKNIVKNIDEIMKVDFSSKIYLLLVDFIKINCLLRGCDEKMISQVTHSIIRAVFEDVIILVDALEIEFGIQIQDYAFRKDILYFPRNFNKKQNLEIIKYRVKTSQYISPELIVQQLAITKILGNFPQAQTSITIDALNQMQNRLNKILKQKFKGINQQIIIKQWELTIDLIKIIIIDHTNQNQVGTQMKVIQTSKAYLMAHENQKQSQPPHDFLFHEFMEKFTKQIYSSSQFIILVLTVLSFRSPQSQLYLIQVLDLLHKEKFDPKIRYGSYQGYYGPFQGYWELIIINQLLENRRLDNKPNISKGSNFKSVNLSERVQKQEITYLQNMIECILVNSKNIEGKYSKFMKELKSNNFMNFIVKYAPINNLSYIYYQKDEIWSDSQSYSLFSEPSSSYMGSSSNSTSKKTKNKAIHTSIQENSSSISLRDYQGVIGWGEKMNIPTINPKFKQIDVIKICCGNFHALFATRSAVYGYGQNQSNQLGQSNFQDTKNNKCFISSPIIILKFQSPVSNFPTEAELTLGCGNYHTAILLNRKLHMFGQNGGGILGGQDSLFDSIACGGLHTIGIRNHQIYSWGRGEGGQLGQPIQALEKREKEQTVQYYIEKPMKINGVGQIWKVVCGDAHTICLNDQGEVYVFGFCYQGQLGLGITGDGDNFQVFEPVRLQYFVSRKVKIIDIFAGGTYSFFKSQTGELYGCGLNDCNQLGVDRALKIFNKSKDTKDKYYGQNDTIYKDQSQNKKHKIKKVRGDPEFSFPKKLQIFDPKNSSIQIMQIACGQSHSIAHVKYNGSQNMMMGWGDNRHMEVTPDAGEVTVPRTIDCLFGVDVCDIGCGSNYSMLLTEFEQWTMLDCNTLVDAFMKDKCMH